ncbi:MAG TPA: sel1 repeat family protein [Chromatiales bacterium]|nr:sel1 repeat family protein [Chromatiales bacterium]
MKYISLFLLITLSACATANNCDVGAKYASQGMIARALSEWGKHTYDETTKELARTTIECLKVSGLATDDHAAVKWLESAAAQAIPAAEAQLGIIYYNGIGVKQSKEKGVALLKSAADHGDVSAKVTLAIIMAYGDKEFRNLKTAEKLLTDAAKSGSTTALKALEKIKAR